MMGISGERSWADYSDRMHQKETIKQKEWYLQEVDGGGMNRRERDGGRRASL